MKVKGLGVDFRLMTIDDIEQVRQWRNSPTLLPLMHNRKIIEPAEQLAWFQSIDKSSNYFFMIEHENKDIGFCSLKNIELDTLKAEPGIFIAIEEYFGSPAGIAILITLLEFGRIARGINNYYGHVLASNKRAISNYESIGANVILRDSQESVMMFFENYSPLHAKVARAKKMLIEYYGSSNEVEIVQ